MPASGGSSRLSAHSAAPASITADHGNAENELTAEGAPQTAHTTNPVPCILTRLGGGLASGGELRDLAPTVLALLGVERPEAMTGKPLVKPL